MGERNYNQGVADGIRSCNPALRELSKQITDLRSRLAEVERKHGELHDELAAEFTDRMVAEARAEAAEQRLRDAEEALEKQVEQHADSLRKTARGRRDRGAFEGQLAASEEALVRVMTIRLKGAG